MVALSAVVSLHTGKSPPGELDHATSGAVVQFLQSSASSAVFTSASAREGTVCIKAWATHLQAAKLWLAACAVRRSRPVNLCFQAYLHALYRKFFRDTQCLAQYAFA